MILGETGKDTAAAKGNNLGTNTGSSATAAPYNGKTTGHFHRVDYVSAARGGVSYIFDNPLLAGTAEDQAKAGVGTALDSITIDGIYDKKTGRPTANITKALLYWHMNTQYAKPATTAILDSLKTVTFNGTNVSGTFIGVSFPGEPTQLIPHIPTIPAPPGTFDLPRGTYRSSVAFRADVTEIVKAHSNGSNPNGVYTLRNYTRNDSEGVAPAPLPGQRLDGSVDLDWDADAFTTGFSLLVFFDDREPGNDVDVRLVDGNDSNTNTVNAYSAIDLADPINPVVGYDNLGTLNGNGENSDAAGWDVSADIESCGVGKSYVQVHVADGHWGQMIASAGGLTFTPMTDAPLLAGPKVTNQTTGQVNNPPGSITYLVGQQPPGPPAFVPGPPQWFIGGNETLPAISLGAVNIGGLPGITQPVIKPALTPVANNLPFPKETNSTAYNPGSPFTLGNAVGNFEGVLSGLIPGYPAGMPIGTALNPVLAPFDAVLNPIFGSLRVGGTWVTMPHTIAAGTAGTNVHFLLGGMWDVETYEIPQLKAGVNRVNFNLPGQLPVPEAPIVGGQDNLNLIVTAFISPSLPLPSDQYAGSVLFFPVYTSSTSNAAAENTRISITNTCPDKDVATHLFFVDGASCSIADSYVCLTANQTVSFLASDIDPGVRGYVIAVAVDKTTGAPIAHNYLVGDEYVKFASGHESSLGAEAVQALVMGLYNGLPPYTGTFDYTMRFNGDEYGWLPRVLAASNVPSRADGNDTLLIVDRIGGNLFTGASTLGTIFGILYDDAENAYSFNLSASTCQSFGSITNDRPRTVPRFESVIPASRSGWMKLWTTNDNAIIGAQINRNRSANSSPYAYNHGHNLHILTKTGAATLTVPVFPPNC